MDRLHLVRYIAVFRDLLLELSHLTTPPPPCADDAVCLLGSGCGLVEM